MKDRVKKGLELFVFFFKIGCFTFGGGWSILAQMEQEFVDKRKWLTKSELLDMVAVGRSVPGIMITNISMIFGYSVGGVFGGFCAVLGITTPAILILSIVTMFYSKLKDNVWCASALRGIRSAVVPIIASAAFSLGKEAFKTKISVTAGVIALLLCAFTNIGNIELVGLGVGSVVIWQLFSVPESNFARSVSAMRQRFSAESASAADRFAAIRICPSLHRFRSRWQKSRTCP